MFISEESTFHATRREIYRHMKTTWRIEGRMYTVSSYEKKEIVTADGFPTVFGETRIFQHGAEDAAISYDNEIFFMPVSVDSMGQHGMLLTEAYLKKEAEGA